MAGETKQDTIAVNIMGKTYTFRVRGNAQAVRAAAIYVDQQLRQLHNQMPSVPLESLAVLLAVKLADRLVAGEGISNEKVVKLQSRLLRLISQVTNI